MEPSIIAIAGLKGGTGKTTTAIYLAASMHKRDIPVTVIDADSEKSALNWAMGGLPYSVVEVEQKLGKQAKALKADGHMVVIDCSPNNRDVLLLAAMVADFVIVPTSVSGAEVNRLEATLDLLVEVEETRDKDLVHILLTRWNSNRVLSNEFLEAFEGYPILKHKISNRVKYQSEFGTFPRSTIEYSEVLHEVLFNG